MAWVKIDDHFDEHPKLAAVGPIGWGVWLAGLAYCNRNLTDGFIPHAIAEGIGGKWRVRVPQEDGREQVWRVSRSSGMHGEDLDSEWVAALLVRERLWEEVPGGYVVHDYTDYQPTREESQALSMKRAEAGAKGAQAKSKQVAKQSAGKLLSKTLAKVCSGPVPDPDPECRTPETSETQSPTSSSSGDDPADAGAAEAAATREPEPAPPAAPDRLPVPETPGDVPPAALTAGDIVNAWNEICPPVLPEVRDLTDDRRDKLRNRLVKPGRDATWWRDYFARIRASPFLCGEGPGRNGCRPFRATFDWAISGERNVAKVLEGNYDGEVIRNGIARGRTGPHAAARPGEFTAGLYQRG